MPPHPQTTIRSRLFGAALVIAAFTLPLPVAWGSFALPLLLAAWLLGPDLRARIRLIGQSAPAWLALVLLGLFFAAALWRRWPEQDALNFSMKYLKLCLLPIIIGGTQDPRTSRRALDAFLLGLGIEVLISYLRASGIAAPFPDPNQRYIGLINHIAYGFMLAFGCYVLLWRALDRTASRRTRLLYATLAAAFCANLLLLNAGRSGYVEFFAVLLLLFVQRRGAKGVALGAALGVVLLALAMQLSTTTRQRIVEIPSNLIAMREGNLDTSAGIRLEHYRRALQLIRKHWLLGVGTGGFDAAYQSAFGADAQMPTNNPENEYLLVVAQLGVLGGLVLFAWCIAMWRAASALPARQRDPAQALLVAMAMGCVFNSQLLDALEGRFFVVMLGVLLTMSRSAARGTVEG